MSTYTGHPGWTAWSVALWLANDEGLYTLALECKRRAGNDVQAAEHMLHMLHNSGVTATPDGAVYSKTNLRYALRDL